VGIAVIGLRARDSGIALASGTVECVQFEQEWAASCPRAARGKYRRLPRDTLQVLRKRESWNPDSTARPSTPNGTRSGWGVTDRVLIPLKGMSSTCEDSGWIHCRYTQPRRALEHGCNDGWVCEVHPSLGWPHDDCAGPGMPCPVCQPTDGRPRMEGWVSFISAEEMVEVRSNTIKAVISGAA
jgi:hypothetical protein